MDIYIAKLLDASLLGIYYLIGGVTLSILVNKISIVKDYKQSPTIVIIMDLLLTAALAMIASTILRDVISYIPFPEMGGYKHQTSKDLGGGIMIAYAVLSFLTNFKEKLKYLVIERLGAR